MYQLILLIYVTFAGVSVVMASKSSLVAGFYFLTRACIFAYKTAVLTRITRLRRRDYIPWLLGTLKVYILYYEYLTVKHYFTSIPKQGTMEVENLGDNPIEEAIKRLLYAKEKPRSPRNQGGHRGKRK